MSSLARLVTERPRSVLLVVAGLSLLAFAQIVDLRTGEPKLALDPALDRLMSDEDAARISYDEMLRRFNNDESVVVALVADQIFSPEVLPRVARITNELARLPEVRSVVSLSTALNIRGVDGDLTLEPFYDGLPETPGELARLEQEALSNPVYAGNLISSDGRATALIVKLRDLPEAEFNRRGVDLQILAIAKREAGSAQVWVTGPARLKAETSRVLLRDIRLVVPLAFGIASLVAFLSFRTLRGVVIPASTIGLALLWTLGVIAATDRPLNMVTTIVPPLLLSVGLAYTVHVLSAYYASLHEHGPGRPGAVVTRDVLRDVGVPVLLTGITTCAGFLALTLSGLSAIREFGWFATVGVAATVALSLSFAPALLSLLRVPDALPAAGGPGRLERAFARLGEFDLRHNRAVIAFWCAVSVLAVLGILQIRVSNDLVTNFRPETAVRQDFEAVNRNLEGANPFHVVLTGGQRAVFKQPENLRIVKDLSDWIESQPEVGSATSVVDYVELINWGFHDNDPAFLAIPETAALTDQLLFFAGNDEIENFVDSRFQVARILVRSTAAESGELRALIDRIERHLTELPERLDGVVTGNVVLITKAMDEIARGQIQSLAVAFLVIYLILAFLFTSARIGLVALIPNLVPVLLYFGIMGWTGVSLSVVTGLVACIVLGIAVDDSIHYMSRFSVVARECGEEQRGTVEALRSVGRPMTYTTVALCLGFATLLVNELRSQREFGALGATTLFLAWTIDVTLTPALCSRLRIVTLWDLLRIDLGPDPQQQIPVLRGLRRAQARIVALMMGLERVAAGKTLLRQGEQGDSMYVVVDGELRAWLDTADGRQELARLRRGDVVGEVAIFYGKRTAYVEATREARLLRISLADLERLRARYPRIGAVVYRNLSKVLAQRLANTTGLLRDA